MGRYTRKAAVINVPSKVGPENWRECWLKTAERTPLFGINECFMKKCKRLYRGLAEEHGYGQYGTMVGPNPVFWDRDRYRKRAGSVVMLHGRGTRFAKWPGFNSERSVTVVVIWDKVRKEEITVLNTHWVPQPGKKVFGPWRAWAILQSRRKINAIIKEHLKAGREVWVMGDLNTFGKVFLHKVKWLREKGIDKIGVALPKGKRLIKGIYKTFTAPTDHKHGVRALALIGADDE